MLSRGIFGVTVSAALFTATAITAQTYFVVGTGGVTGVYYPTGGAICRLVNRTSDETGLKCAVEPSSGSIANIQAIRSGTMEFGVVQSDWQYHAVEGDSVFQNDGPFSQLRSVMSLHPEPFTVLARADADASVFEDLKGKRVNIGSPGSGQRNTTEILLDALGWTTDDFGTAIERQAVEQSAVLCGDVIDATVYVVGHPSGAVQEATTACDSRLVSVSGEVVDELVEAFPFYREAVIPGGLYRGNADDVPTFGVGATLVTSTDVPVQVVYDLTKAIFDNLDDFRMLHPALANLSETEMVEAGLSAPLHDGALRYYRERGWVQ
ncbi:TAXI family TRAP transporter solute-binding subunit [Qingshengfaniella alkalisoli]|uniref:TAXI family TRAP transporter solute-binding subunit n=1 Tax=Qingshengfaniella alkalisoli TaxID=2599296 RepID=A0A5B8I7I9_9RHOB|nr:TAXI family TRAP transporter solute-binding subunit [Qingshengfaniella alkalisoli]QDY69755.1 TAXI family TRAP transporter solute-binding subunit [Qingshengfaniella alkalisoli]